ncbi:hypothetical protein ACP70R_019300 [Stipagrostis hirtigluma subsp. patula]
MPSGISTPPKHTMHAMLCNQNLELDAEILCQDKARNLMLIRIREMPRAYPVMRFCDSSNVPVRSNVLLVAYLNTFPNRFSFGPGPVPEVLLFMLPGACPGKTAEPPQDTSGVVSHTCVGHGLEGCLGGPLIFQGRVIGVHTGSDLQIRHGHATSTESVNAAMKDWLQIPPDASKTTGEMIQSFPF